MIKPDLNNKKIKYIFELDKESSFIQNNITIKSVNNEKNFRDFYEIPWKIYDGDKKVSKDDFLKMVKEHYENFDSKYIVYKDLRGKNFVVRPGLKFGADFGVYEHGPGIDHAPFIVHVLPNTKKISAIEMVRAGRLATSVRKKFIIATLPLPDKINYFIFTWFKP